MCIVFSACRSVCAMRKMTINHNWYNPRTVFRGMRGDYKGPLSSANDSVDTVRVYDIRSVIFEWAIYGSELLLVSVWSFVT